ncbi:SRPBCC family protein [Elongatibacter sediminis]|uniref:SRPBCC family protein n=1 Tax=Elongatibacter sediminis TaxID=3119006 RepID=A0AAW9RE64_9GAMM
MGKTYQSIVIRATADRVWQAIRDFHDMSWAPSVITSIQPVGDIAGDQPGAGRILNGAFHETLQKLDDAERYFEYRMVDGPSPVSKADVRQYRGCVRVSPATQDSGTLVEWSSCWQRNEKAAAEFCRAVYAARLEDLKAQMEAH